MRTLRTCAACTILIILAAGCGRNIEINASLPEPADIFPDYRDVTVPENIAPLNFSYSGDSECALIVNGKTLRPGRSGNFSFRKSQWREWMRGDSLLMTLAVKKDGLWSAYEPFVIYISRDRIDPYISYRLIPPGYQGWQYMAICQRDIQSYRETLIHSNRSSGGNCVNCHTCCDKDPETFVFHARADFGGTMMVKDGKVTKLDTKTDSTMSALVYPYWHPGGRYIAFSVNKTLQSFFNHDPNRIEVFDSASDVVVLDTETMSLIWSPLTKRTDRCETFPCFSPDGNWLYFCACETPEKMPRDYDKAKYSIYRIAFDGRTGGFGDEVELVFDAAALGKSASFPRVSPDGRFLAFTMHAYGNFSIWHRDADLWMVDLSNGEVSELSAFNSPEVESWHCWSSNGRWMLLSSRRDDGLYTRPYIGYIDEKGNAHKPFLLPQKEPAKYYKSRIDSYNLPEFMTGPVSVSRRTLTDVMRSDRSVKVR